jgi:hypothetical protein
VGLIEKYNKNGNMGSEGKSFIDYVSDDMNLGFIDNLMNDMQII